MRWHQLAEMASGAYLHHPINQLIACATSSPSIVALPCSLPRRSVPDGVNTYVSICVYIYIYICIYIVVICF
jgi:hypothetical protein